MSDGYRDDGTGTEDWGVTRITEQVAAWPSVPSSTLDNQQFYRRMSAAYSQRLRTTAEALRPLVALLQHHNDRADRDDSTPVFAINGAIITLGDLRKCRAILARLEQEGLA